MWLPKMRNGYSKCAHAGLSWTKNFVRRAVMRGTPGRQRKSAPPRNEESIIHADECRVESETHRRRTQRASQLYCRREWRSTRGVHRQMGGNARVAQEKVAGASGRNAP